MPGKNPYDLLGVPSGATTEEIRSAYLKRTKVLHPDRFNKVTQPVEWQMANDMLQELNEAYAKLKTKTQKFPDNGYSSSSSTSRPQANAPPSSARGVDLAKSQRTWDAAGASFIKSEQTPVVDLGNDNFDQHMTELNRHVRVNFESQMAIAQLDRANVDELVVECLSLLTRTLLQYSNLYTERIILLSRAKYFQIKYPFWKTLWVGWQNMGISKAENEADQREMNSINPRLSQMGTEANQIQADSREQLSVICIKLLAKYGDKFVV